jgi:hypothetical protein
MVRSESSSRLSFDPSQQVFMIRFQAALVFLALFAGSSAPAQVNIAFQEDFETGLPPGWQVTNFTPAGWHVAPAGECGAVTSMLAFNRGPTNCDTGAGTGTLAATLYTPPLHFADGVPFILTFDYILEFDASGDQCQVGATSSSWINPVLFADSSSFINDGALHSISLQSYFFVDGLGPTRIFFSCSADGVGDLGRGFLIDNVRLTSVNTGATLCNGQLPGLCPCLNSGAPLLGCANSTGLGAALSAFGRASLSADTLQLQVSQLPANCPALFFMGDIAGPVFAGDGRRCVSFAHRVGTRSASSGAAVFPSTGGAGLSALTQPTVQTVQHYQVMYRDPAGPCGHAFNFSNGFAVTWRP